MGSIRPCGARFPARAPLRSHPRGDPGVSGVLRVGGPRPQRPLLEEARQLLEGSEEPVEAIALAVGYEDAAFFGRLFRRRVGLTPAAYRRRFGALRRALRGSGDHG
ncbi:MAG: hypothetical protein ER33_11235 [Cyanobium sp. CACIAM 14]|nr:MAG: hypothetical protein ER33_11235 [Cyanobium sp. CACIAM 14]